MVMLNSSSRSFSILRATSHDPPLTSLTSAKRRRYRQPHTHPHLPTYLPARTRKQRTGEEPKTPPRRRDELSVQANLGDTSLARPAATSPRRSTSALLLRRIRDRGRSIRARRPPPCRAAARQRARPSARPAASATAAPSPGPPPRACITPARRRSSECCQEARAVCDTTSVTTNLPEHHARKPLLARPRRLAARAARARERPHAIGLEEENDGACCFFTGGSLGGERHTQHEHQSLERACKKKHVSLAVSSVSTPSEITAEESGAPAPPSVWSSTSSE